MTGCTWRILRRTNATLITYQLDHLPRNSQESTSCHKCNQVEQTLILTKTILKSELLHNVVVQK